eukprot:scaffold168712_cov31-Tisochrysis_lutea.AAC.4
MRLPPSPRKLPLSPGPMGGGSEAQAPAPAWLTHMKQRSPSFQGNCTSSTVGAGQAVLELVVSEPRKRAPVPDRMRSPSP